MNSTPRAECLTRRIAHLTEKSNRAKFERVSRLNNGIRMIERGKRASFIPKEEGWPFVEIPAFNNINYAPKLVN